MVGTLPVGTEHSDAKGGNGADTDTVIFQAESATARRDSNACTPTARSARSRTFSKPSTTKSRASWTGTAARCACWIDGQASRDGRQRVLLPNMDRPVSEFAAEMGQQIGPRKVWFNKAETVVAVAMRRFSEKIDALGFHPIQPVEACTAAEQFVQTGVLRRGRGDRAT